MNRVEVFSSTSQTRVAQISVPGASSADLSADGATIWIGTALEQIVAIDSATLKTRNRYVVTGLTPIPGTIFSRPVEVLSLACGKAMVRLRQPVSSKALLALWDPVSNLLTDLTSTAPALFQQGVGVLARSGDHSRVLPASNDSSGELAIYDSNGHIVAGPVTLGAGLIRLLVANSDGSRFAALFAGNAGTQMLLLDASLNQVMSSSLTELNFGNQSASNATVNSAIHIQATSPSSVSNGAVNLTAYFQNGWLAIAADAFSYGPQILQIFPNAAANTGGDFVQICGYGFGSDPTKISVKIGGAIATVQKLENVSIIAPSLALDSSYPFSLECITLQTPPGSSGKADVFVSSPAGSTTSAKSFQYLQSVASNSLAGFLRFLLYDQARQQVYVTNLDHIEVFSLQQNTFGARLLPPGGLAPNIGLRGLALTPIGRNSSSPISARKMFISSIR